ncbi:MAG: hypothetical protein ABI584_10405 [Acidobacteriota bacterium]
MTTTTRRFPRALAFTALLAALLGGLPLPAAAQTNRTTEFPFAFGAGGFAVTDTGRAADVKAFSTGGFRAFFDVELDAGVILEARYENFQLPGSAVTAPPFETPAGDSPKVKVNGGALSVGYVFRETWWQAGLTAGVGVYGLSPRDPGPGQVPADVSETVIGWNAGLLTIFKVSARWDFRVEATGYLLRTDASHKPILLGASLAYRF